MIVFRKYLDFQRFYNNGEEKRKGKGLPFLQVMRPK